MSGSDIDRTLTEWFEAEVLAGAPTDGVERALAGARRRTPRPAWLAAPGSHWGWSDAGARLSTGVLPRSRMRWSTALVLLVVLAALLGGALLVGSRVLESRSLPLGRLGQLAYALDDGIFVADWDGRNPTRVADGWAEGPLWSPDGRLLAYRTSQHTDAGTPRYEGTVHVSDPAGTVLASFPGVGWRIAWSPDSTRLATWLDLYPMTTIGVYGIDGVREATLPVPAAISQSDGLGGDFDPVWSPDGRSLLLPTEDPSTMVCSPDARTCGYPRAVWEVPVDGRQPWPLPADDPRSNWPSSRSPDGTRVAYVAKPLDGGFEATLVVAEADGSRPRELFTGRTQLRMNDVAWSPTGDRIALVAGDAGVDRYAELLDVPTGLRVVDVETGSVTTPVSVDLGVMLSVIAFSPEGDRILFWRYDDESTGPSIWSVDSDGSDPHVLVSGTSSGGWQTLPAEPSPSHP